MMYVIAWRSLLTEATGRGTAAFTRDSIESYVNELNKKYEGELFHWLEPVNASG